MWKKKCTKVRITQKIGKERENSYQKIKRSPEERHTQTHENLNDIFRGSQMPFLIRREFGRGRDL